MMKKLIQGIGLLAMCLLASAISVSAAETESVTLKADGNKADVVLELPKAGGYDEALSLQLAFSVKTTKGDADKNIVSFDFDKGIASTVKTYRYQEDTGVLTIYISGTQNLFEKEKLALGKVIVESEAKYGVTATVGVVEDSLQTVNGAYSMRETAIAASKPVQISVGNGGLEVIKKAQNPAVKPGSLTFTAGGKAATLKISKAKGTVTYKSSDNKVAKVNSKGKVTPKSAGKAVITVKAAGNDQYHAKTIKIKVTVKPVNPAKITGVKVSGSGAGGCVKVKWKKKAGVTGYQIRYANNEKMKNCTKVRVAKGKATSKELMGLMPGQYVYIQVRAYRTEGGVTSYGEWSKKVKSAQIH